MEKLNKKDKFNIFWIVVIYLAIALIITHGEFIFGSSTDWGFQHITFPEYFRMLFYETHDIFPDFALNIGGGQNIYYFAYYGLLSPIILISYLLPFIPMSFYIIFSTLLLGIISIYLFYKWINGFNFSSTLCFVLTLMFAMAGPLLFHSHRHIMFINYMPFLLLGLIGVRKYFSNGSKWLMIISIFLMVMTSYYYSVGGILCLTVYGIYEYLKINDKFVLKDFVRKGVAFALLVITGVLMAGVILMPVIYALMNGRGESFGGVSLLEALLPSINLEFLLYKSYSVGLLGIAFISIIYMFFMKNEKRFLGIVLSLLIIFPIFVYVLNGALYLDGKALIPFLPLYVLTIGYFLEEVLSGKVNFKIVFLTIIISLLWIYLEDNSLKLYFTLDCILLLLLLFLYEKFNKENIIIIPLVIISVLVCLGVNLSDSLVTLEDFGKQNDPLLEEITEDIAQSDKGVYRMAINLKASTQLVNHVDNIHENITTLYSSTYNTNYNYFFYDFNNNRASRNMFITSETKNTLFETLMGVKYLITDKKAPLGYEVWRQYGDYTVYINENTLPLGYATDSVINSDDYEKLDYPNDDLALIGNVVTDAGDYKYNSLVKEIPLNLNDGDKKNLIIQDYKDGYKVTVKNEAGGTLRVKLDEEAKQKIYLLRFTVEKPQGCSLGDTTIEVNGINNKLTCASWKYFNSNYTFDYTLSSNDNFDYLDIKFSKGTHYISKAELYSLNYDDFVNSFSDIDTFEIDEAIGDKISGSIDVTNDGYFNLSIPYDKGFIIKVDGKEVDYEKVNKSFIGFPIEKGEHKIEIEFKAPNALLGKIISMFGFGIFIIVLVYDGVSRRKVNG